MKTDRFDKEFRRKLLGLPADTDSGEVERVHDYVRTNKPALPGTGWSKLLLYGGSSLLLIGSLSYNLLQNYRNTRLQSSIDSLAHQSISPTTSGEVIRHDTVYITRSDNTKGVGIESVDKPEKAVKEPLEPAKSTQSDETRRSRSLAMGNTEPRQLGNESSRDQPDTDSPLTTSKPRTAAKSNASTTPNQRSEPSGQERTEADNIAESSSNASLERSTTGKNRLAKEKNSISASRPDEGENASTAYPNNRTLSAARSDKRQRTKARSPMIPSETRQESLATNYAGHQKQRIVSAPSTFGSKLVNTENATLFEPTLERSSQTIAVQPLAIPPAITTSKQRTLIVTSQPLLVARNVAPAQPARKSWHLTMPNLSVPNAQYRIGGGFAVSGEDELSGTLLGEVRLNPRWSVQAGLRLMYSPGFHYRNDQEFDDHHGEDFRQKYASQLSQSVDIQDIRQMSLLVQVPIQVAYHYPLGRQWGLRLGVGTDLDVLGRSIVSYDYRENSRSSEHELSRSKVPVYVFNNLTLSTSLERSWKKWLFRAGPFISPQLRPVDYRPEDLSWGANLQILYRLGK